MIEAVRAVFVTIVGPQVEVSDDLHLLGEDVEDISLEKCVSNSLNQRKVELFAEMVQNGVFVGRVFAVLTEFGDRGSVGARADEDLVDVFSIDFSIIAEIKNNFLVNSLTRKLRSWSPWGSPSLAVVA